MNFFHKKNKGEMVNSILEYSPKILMEAGIYHILAMDYSHNDVYLILNYKGKLSRIILYMGVPIDEDIISLVGARVDINEVNEYNQNRKEIINRILK